MTGSLKLVGVCGSPQRPSRTRVLVEAVLETVHSRVGGDVRVVSVGDVWPLVGAALRRSELAPEGEAVISEIEAADLLVIGTPVYRASYTGTLKHIFDLVDQYALTGKPVILAATGGSDRHTLMIEHELRPLMGFFSAAAVSTGIYATETAFRGYHLASDDIRQRIVKAAREAVRLIGPRYHPRAEVATHVA
jgi:FMN reductase